MKRSKKIIKPVEGTAERVVRKLIRITLAICVLLICLWPFVGFVYVPRYENESSYDLFWKKVPTFQMYFFDTYMPGMRNEQKNLDENEDWVIGSEGLNGFLEYCKYRYGITNDDPIKARTLCKEKFGYK